MLRCERCYSSWVVVLVPWNKSPQIAMSLHSDKSPQIAMSLHSDKSPQIAMSLHSDKSPQIAMSLDSDKSSKIAMSLHSDKSPQIAISLHSDKESTDCHVSPLWHNILTPKKNLIRCLWLIDIKSVRSNTNYLFLGVMLFSQQILPS
jgi:hypothetical protein